MIDHSSSDKSPRFKPASPKAALNHNSTRMGINYVNRTYIPLLAIAAIDSTQLKPVEKVFKLLQMDAG
jgi:membrane protein YdbS with pleckstrin-like domain